MRADTGKRPSQRPRPVRPDQGLVQAVGNGGSHTEQLWVHCTRHGASVPAEECRQCPHCVAVSLERGGEISAVHCQPPETATAAARPRVVRLASATVGDLMTRNVVCVRPELSLDAVVELFLGSGFKALPVVNDVGKVVGVVSEYDVLLDVHARSSEPAVAAPAAAADGGAAPSLDASTFSVMPEGRSVEDVMMPVLFTLPEDAPATQAAALMAFEAQHQVVVVGDQGRVVGILSSADLLYWLAKADGFALPRPRRVAR